MITPRITEDMTAEEIHWEANVALLADFLDRCEASEYQMIYGDMAVARSSHDELRAQAVKILKDRANA